MVRDINNLAQLNDVLSYHNSIFYFFYLIKEKRKENKLSEIVLKVNWLRLSCLRAKSYEHKSRIEFNELCPLKRSIDQQINIDGLQCNARQLGQYLFQTRQSLR